MPEAWACSLSLTQGDGKAQPQAIGPAPLTQQREELPALRWHFMCQGAQEQAFALLALTLAGHRDSAGTVISSNTQVTMDLESEAWARPYH